MGGSLFHMQCKEPRPFGTRLPLFCFHQVFYGYAVEVFVRYLFESAPHPEGAAAVRALARLIAGETRDGSEAALGQAQNIADNALLRRSAEPVSAAFAVDALNISVLYKQSHYLLHIFF